MLHAPLIGRRGPRDLPQLHLQSLGIVVGSLLGFNITRRQEEKKFLSIHILKLDKPDRAGKMRDEITHVLQPLKLPCKKWKPASTMEGGTAWK